MYSESDLEAAVAAGALSPEAVAALRRHVAAQRQTPAVDEENFRLLTGFNDIFVGIATVIMLVAVASIGNAVHTALAGALTAVTAWALAEFFTLKRRMALPSIILLLAFVGGIAGAQIGLLVEHGEAWFGSNPDERLMALLGGVIGLVTAAGAWFHWRRFAVPITVAAGAAALALTAFAGVVAIVGDIGPDQSQQLLMTLVFLAGLAIFYVAMRWDMSDRARETRRSDVAFWLHLLAAPMIAHPLFHWLGVTQGDVIGAGAAMGVIGLYVAMGLVALAVDRRALLVSALAYVLAALTYLFREFGVVELNVALTALVIGSALLCLSAFWTPIRRAWVERLPGTLQALLPTTHLKTA